MAGLEGEQIPPPYFPFSAQTVLINLISNLIWSGEDDESDITSYISASLHPS